ncbi:MAG: hypothetical protein JW837_05270 [Sedimentisphaerales bacterium]|nr:hypothetical protein [Sedimentisphaerales bacterium]
MYRKLVYLIPVVLVLVFILTGTAGAELVGWWKLDDGTGSIATDSSGSGNDGTFEGDPEWVSGKYGLALEFDGDDWVNCGSPTDLIITEQISITCWVNPAQLGGEQGFAGLDAGYYLKAHDQGVRFTTPGILDHSSANLTLEAGEWQHVAVTFQPGQNEGLIFYHNGVETERLTSSDINLGTGPFRIGNNQWNEYLTGMIDDVRVYNHILTEGEILGAMEGGEGWPYVLGPSPADGALYEDTWVSLGWRAGDFAVSHNVYMGINFDDVNDGVEGTFQGNQTETFFVAGFPGFAFPDGLVPGTTYYWRIDEVNDAEPNSPWKGPVWSFSIPSKTAYNPVPADGAKFIATETQLSWTIGFGGKLHTVYFGDNFDDVNNATGGLPQGTTTFSPGTLEPDKTYYWRVDEFDAVTTYKGDVWSFTTAGEGGGVKGTYYSGMNFNSLVLERIDSQINFSWGDPGGPDPAVGDDNFSVRWRGEVEAAFTEAYTFYTSTDDGVRLWIDGQQLVNSWVDQSTTEHKGTIDLVAGNTYSLLMEYYENGGGAVAELRWSSPSTPKQLIPQAALSLPVRASQASPANGAINVSQTTMLSWSAGETAVSHNVYFGADMEAVKNAGTGSAEYKGSKQLDSESYDPGKLAWDTTYYWRIDEVAADGTITGNLWSFTTANFLIVDDMESYNDLNVDEPGSNRIFLSWIDGFDTPAVNGSIVGYANPPFAELTIVHSGNQSMPFEYDNAVGKSEATLTLTATRDWTENGVDTLAIWYTGDPANAAEQMYVTLNGTARVNNSNPNAALAEDWTEWRIPLQDFTGVNLSNVNSITLGLSSVTGGSGMLFFDDIRLHVSTL